MTKVSGYVFRRKGPATKGKFHFSCKITGENIGSSYSVLRGFIVPHGGRWPANIVKSIKPEFVYLYDAVGAQEWEHHMNNQS